MDDQAGLREHVLELLGGGHAHIDFERAIADLPAEMRGAPAGAAAHAVAAGGAHADRPVGHPPVLVDSAHVSPEFPGGYWPEGDAPPDPDAWDRTIAAFRADLQSMKDLVADPGTDLLAPIPHGQGQTVLREALLVADHNGYHLGQLVTVRRLLGAWHGHG